VSLLEGVGRELKRKGDALRAKDVTRGIWEGYV